MANVFVTKIIMNQILREFVMNVSSQAVILVLLVNPSSVITVWMIEPLWVQMVCVNVLMDFL